MQIFQNSKLKRCARWVIKNKEFQGSLNFMGCWPLTDWSFCTNSVGFLNEYECVDLLNHCLWACGLIWKGSSVANLLSILINAFCVQFGWVSYTLLYILVGLFLKDMIMCNSGKYILNMYLLGGPLGFNKPIHKKILDVSWEDLTNWY